jgi:hypothetical protein
MDDNKKTILVLDNDLSTKNIISGDINLSEKYNWKYTSFVKETLNLLVMDINYSYHLLIISLEVPIDDKLKWGGFELIEYIRAYHGRRISRRPIISLLSNPTNKIYRECSLITDGILIKPISGELLLKKIDQVFKNPLKLKPAKENEWVIKRIYSRAMKFFAGS